jgi:hypothetical protein
MAGIPREMAKAIMDVYEDFYAKGMTDGLPVIPPTRELVAQMVEATHRDPNEVIGIVPPKKSTATVAKIAASAVMAGCRPEYLPVVIAGVEAMIAPELNLTHVACSTAGAALLTIVSGPIADKIELNCGVNVFGEGFRANATIGRALRLVLINLGGVYPGKLDRATQGQGQKFTCCIGENERENPWNAYRIDRGFSVDVSTVTVAAVYPLSMVIDCVNQTAMGVAGSFANAIAQRGHTQHYDFGELFLFLCPEHAALVARDGWSKDDLRWFIFEKARLSVGVALEGGLLSNRHSWPKWINYADPLDRIPPVRKPEEIHVVVTGGPGNISSYAPGFGTYGGNGSFAVTREVRT